jgi:hypothetical protein
MSSKNDETNNQFHNDIEIHKLKDLEKKQQLCEFEQLNSINGDISNTQHSKKAHEIASLESFNEEITNNKSQIETITIQTYNQSDNVTFDNNSAKKQYNRDFLLSLKNKKLSKICPENLKNHVAYIDAQLTSSSNQQTPLKLEQSSFGRENNKKKHGKCAKSDKSLPTKPILFSNNKDLKEKDNILGQVRFILNKLTLKKLDKLANQFVRLEINNTEIVTVVVDIIYERSINKQLSSHTYAQLCRELSRKALPINRFEKVNFRTILLTKCQKEFNTDYIKDINYDQMIADAEAKQMKEKRKK